MLKVRGLNLFNGKSLDLEAAAGDLFLIKGPNGAGKSLFLKSLARLLPSTFEEMSLKGTNTQDTAIEDWRSKLLYLPPEVSFTEEENVEEFLRHPFTFQRYKNFVPNFDPRRYITDLTARVSLLSSGQKQRLALLRALSLNFEVLLLDESLSHMDGETRQEMLCLLSDVRKRGKIILLVTHFDLSITDSLKEFHL